MMRLRKWQNVLVLFVVYYAILFIGAAIIMYIEAKGLEGDDYDYDTANSTEILRSLLNREMNMTTNETNINEIIKMSYKIYTKAKKIKNRKWKKEMSLAAMYKWRYFAHVTTTTVGYGDIVPETDGGKIFVIIYGLIGIPLNILLIAKIGSLLSDCFIRLIRLVEQSIFKVKECKCVAKKTYILLTVLSSVWLFFGAAVTRSTTSWSWTDGFYYAFVKFSTIGYGDILVSFDDNREYVELISWYTVIGLALAAALFNAVGEAMEKEIKAKEMKKKSEKTDAIEIDSVKHCYEGRIDT